MLTYVTDLAQNSTAGKQLANKHASDYLAVLMTLRHVRCSGSASGEASCQSSELTTAVLTQPNCTDEPVWELLSSSGMCS